MVVIVKCEQICCETDEYDVENVRTMLDPPTVMIAIDRGALRKAALSERSTLTVNITVVRGCCKEKSWNFRNLLEAQMRRLIWSEGRIDSVASSF